MNPDDKVKWFIVTGEAILKEFNMGPDTYFFVSHIVRDDSFRVMIEKGNPVKYHKGFAVPRKTSLKEFEKMFQEKLSELKKDATGYAGKGLLSI